MKTSIPNKPLKQVVSKKLNSHTLTPKQQDRIHQLLQVEEYAVKSSNQHFFAHFSQVITRHYKAISACAALLFIVVIAAFPLFNQHVKHQQTIYDIAQETAKNHLKMKPLEVQSQAMAGIRAYFNALDFSPVTSHLIGQQGTYSLLGGRYCSIKGETAAQLRYIDQQGQLTTLFETAYDPYKFQGLPNLDKDEAPVVVHTKGIEVKIWVEKGLVMVSTATLH